MELVQTKVSSLLTSDDPDPVETLNFDSTVPVVLLCEHAGQAVPARLGDLGVSPEILNSHRGWDIGAEAVARRISERLKAPLILQRYSRLVIDTNRPAHSADAIPAMSDAAGIPGNVSLTRADRDARIASIFEPMDRAIHDAFSAAPRSAAFSIHSFTPRYGGFDRPWHAGFLTRKSIETGQALMASVNRKAPDLTLALNEPYRIEDETDWFIPHHAEARDLPHCLIEIRNDQLLTPEGAELWAGLLSDAITEFLETLT